MPDEAATQILKDLAAGDPSAPRRLFPLVYEQLRRIAGAQMRSPNERLTMQPTAVVHEAYLRMVGSGREDWSGRIHFLASAATAVRHVLIDAARARAAQKRGGGARPVTLIEGIRDVTPVSTSPVDLLDLDDALKELAELNERQARLIELKYFGGMTIPDIVEVTGHSRTTVKADLAMARSWLEARLEAGS